jgi:hypothetical protein
MSLAHEAGRSPRNTGRPRSESLLRVRVDRVLSRDNVSSGSWPRDNATEEVWEALDRSVAAQLGRFEHIFSDFGLEATVVRATHPERL